MRKIISRGASKEAALYFDHILPSDVLPLALSESGILAGSTSNCVPFAQGKPNSEIIDSLLPNLNDASDLCSKLNLVESLQWIIEISMIGDFPAEEWDKVNVPVRAAAKKAFGLELDYLAISQDVHGWLKRLNGLRQLLLKQAGFGAAPLWLSEELFQRTNVPDSDEETFAVSIKGLNLVDPDKISWDQLIAFRKDKESRAALRNLRLFFQEEMRGKDTSYVTDKLSQLIDEQERAARLWGLETTQKALSVVFTNKSTIAGFAGGLASAAVGAPLAIAAAGAFVLPFANFALEFARAFIDAEKVKVKRSTRYLTELKKLGASADKGQLLGEARGKQ